MRLRTRLALTAAAVSFMAGLAPAAAATAGTAARPGSPVNGPVSGTVIFRGFPQADDITGGLGTTREECVSSNNGRPFETTEGSQLEASISVKNTGICSVQATESDWRLYVNTPSRFNGTVDFSLSQPHAGQPYYMRCGTSSGGLKCVQGTGLQIYVEPATPLVPIPRGPIVTGTITFRGFPQGENITGGMGPYSSECVTGNDGRPFSVVPGTSINASITVNVDYFPSFCADRKSDSHWNLYVNTPSRYHGSVVFRLGQEHAGEPYSMQCGIGTDGIKCVPGPGLLHIYIEPSS
jgi:hypothetical protein